MVIARYPAHSGTVIKVESIKKLLLANKAWAGSKTALDQDYFADLSKDQQPEYLWIGCSDSRVPTSEITGTDPGVMFVHRNIANLVNPDDENVMGVIQYAVEVLKVKHVIVCGHYQCGGVRAAMGNLKLGRLDGWIKNIKNVLQANQLEFEKITDETERIDRLVELNVLKQVQNLVETEIIRNAWKNNDAPIIHGWVYNLRNGLLKQLKSVGRQSV